VDLDCHGHEHPGYDPSCVACVSRIELAQSGVHAFNRRDMDREGHGADRAGLRADSVGGNR